MVNILLYTPRLCSIFMIKIGLIWNLWATTDSF